VPDQKPPRLAAGELETLLALLQYQRDSLVRKVAGLDDAAARRSPVASGTSLLWLIKHMAGAEITWMLRRFAGQDVIVPDDTPQPGRHSGRGDPVLPRHVGESGWRRVQGSQPG
jgi:Protein of unknown function (DUF664)